MTPASVRAIDGPRDRAAVERLVRRAFGTDADVFIRYWSLLGPEAFRLSWDGDRAVAALAELDLTQWFCGRPVPVRGLAFVSVDPSARGRGEGTTLVREALTDARPSGAALVILYASSPGFYQRLGFAPAGVHLRYRARVDRFTPSGPTDRVEERRVVDYVELDAIRRRASRWSSGALERPTALWEHRVVPMGEAGPGDLWVFPGADGRPGGYLFPSPPLNREIRLYDAGFTDPVAARAAAGFLRGFRAQAETAVWDGGPGDPLAAAVRDGAAEVVDHDVWYARVVDVERALTLRGAAPGAAFGLTLEVRDPLFAANDGRFRIEVGESGTVEVGRDARSPVDFSMSVGGLVPLLTGHLDAAAARLAGWLVGEDRAIHLARRLFGGPPCHLDDVF